MTALPPDYDSDPERWGAWESPRDVHKEVAEDLVSPVLDVGCGTGRLASHLAKGVVTVTPDPRCRIAVLPSAVAGATSRYLRWADTLLPGRVVALYVTGSTALGAYRPNRSDIDLVVVTDRGLSRAEVARLPLLHCAVNTRPFLRAIGKAQMNLPGTANTAFVAADQLGRPVTEIQPIASLVGQQFRRGRAFDVNPVMWKVLVERGIAVRGGEPGALGLDPEPRRLRPWNLANLDSYWAPWAQRLLAGPGPKARVLPRWTTAWGVLGATRLHCTIVTGGIVSKEGAGEYALQCFATRWHPIVREALAYWREEPADPAFAPLQLRTETTARFVLHVVEAAHDL